MASDESDNQPSVQRVLHLVEPDVPGGGRCTLRMIADAVNHIHEVKQDVLILGTAAHVNLARRCGLTGPEMIGSYCPPRPAIARLLAYRPLHRMVMQRERTTGPYAVIHSWTIGAAVLSTLALPHHARLAMFTIDPPGAFETWALRLLMRHDPMLVFNSSNPPPRGVDANVLAATSRDELRERWGIADNEFIIGLLAEPANWADAGFGAAVASRLALAGRRVRLLIHHSAHRRRDTERWSREAGFGDLVIVDDAVAEPWSVVNGLDAAIIAPIAQHRSGIAPMLWARAAKVPVMEHCFDVNTAGERLMKLYDDRTAAAQISEEYSIATLCARLRDAWDAAKQAHQRYAADTTLAD